MIKKIHVGPINRRVEYEVARFLTWEKVTTAMDRAAGQVRCNIEYFGTGLPSSATRNQVYGIIDSIERTDGFWTRLLWLYHEYTGEDASKELALENVGPFLNRVEKRVELDHHGLGFLYDPSCVAGYKLTGSEEGRRAGFLAADKPTERFQEKGGLIQAWGELGVRDNYRLVIDCLLNIPPLHWASLETRNPVYKSAALRYYETACNNVIRDDVSAYHTFYSDLEAGEPLRDVTRQGYSDDSAWARDQVWGIYGIPLNYRYVKNDNAFILLKGMTDYFLNRLSEDEVCYWDLMFTDGSGQPRDSSTVAIGVCGTHKMLKCLPEVESSKDTYRHVMHCILRSLMERHMTPEIKAGNSVLLHDAYSWHSGKGVGEDNIWGDYYYMEALMRFHKDWNLYW